MNDILPVLVSYVEQAEDQTARARANSEQARDYYDNIQWTAQERKTLEQRGQPAITDNRIKRKINYLTGLEKVKRTDPKAFPRTPNDEEAAQAATDTLRYVAENQNFDSVRSLVWENMLIEGIGIAAVEWDGREIIIRQIPWHRFLYDPTSSRHDFSDAQYFGEVVWMDYDRAKRRFPGHDDELDAMVKAEGETYDDRPSRWVIGDKRKRVKVITVWYQIAGKWHWATITKGAILKQGRSPYRGESACPIIAQSTYINRQNDRYGEVDAMIPLQDEVNKRRSKSLHLLVSRQIVMEEGAVSDERDMKRELAKPDGVVTVTPGKRFERLDMMDNEVAGHFNLLADVKADLDQMGANNAMIGKNVEGSSGRAILASQQGGQTEIATLMDRLRDFNIRVYRAIWDRVRQFWEGERWIRVTDDQKNMKFVGLNRTVTAMEALQERLAKEKASPEQVQRVMTLAQQDPRSQMPVTLNAVNELDIDIIVEDAPDTVTIQAENFDRIVQLAEAGVPFPPDVLVEMMPSLRNREELLERLRGDASPEQVQAAKVQQEMAMRGMAADVAKKEAEADKTRAEVRETDASAIENITRAGENYADALSKLGPGDPGLNQLLAGTAAG